MTRRAPNECPRCRSRQVERFPDSTLYDCGFALFDDGTSVADDYPDECNYRRIELLEHQLSRSRAEAERWQARYEALREAVVGVVERIDAAEGEEHHSSLVDYSQYHAGREDAFERTGEWLREVLAEAGGGDR